jgi:hypothetical protein
MYELFLVLCAKRENSVFTSVIAQHFYAVLFSLYDLKVIVQDWSPEMKY